MITASHREQALQELDALCARAAQGDLSARILNADQYGELAPMLTNFNRLLDLTEAYIRESSASLAAAADGRYARRFLPAGMVGAFRRGAEIIDRARAALAARAAGQTPGPADTSALPRLAA